jgi:hypothetical protein
MILTPKHIIFIAVSNYLSVEDCIKLRTELSKNKSITGQKFINIIERYFDFKILRDKPLIPEDIWLFNYLMYDNRNKEKQMLFEIGEKVNVAAGLKRTPLIKNYESKIILPQLKGLQEANMILSSLN